MALTQSDETEVTLVDPTELPETSGEGGDTQAPPAKPESSFTKIKQALGKGMSEVMAKSAGKPVETPAPSARPQDPPASPKKPEVAKPTPVADKARAIKVPEKPAETTPTAIKSDEGRKHWKELTADRDSWRKQAEEFKAQIESVKAAPVPELDKLKAERDQLAQELERVALERSPAFQAKYDARFKQAVSAAKRLASENADKVEVLMQQPPSKGRNAAVLELSEDLDEFSKLQLASAFSAMDSARDEMQYELANHRETIARHNEMAKLTDQARRTHVEASRKQLMSDVLKKATEAYSSFQRNDDAEHNAIVAENEEDVRKFIMGEVDEGTAAFLPVLANEAIHLSKTKIPALEARIKELEAELTRYNGSMPKPNDAGPAVEGEPPTSNDGDPREGQFKRKLSALLKTIPR